MSYIEDQASIKSKSNSVTCPSFNTIDSSKLNVFLNASTTIITSNQRLSRFRLHAYENEQIKEGKNIWETPQILPWAAWLRLQWDASRQGVWLHPQQESLLWRECISEDENTHVLNPKALAKQAMEACKIITDFNIDETCLQHAGEEHLALWRWKKNMEQKTKHVLEHQVLPLLIQNTSIPQSATLLLDGFDSFTASQLDYFKHLQHLGCDVFEIKNDTATANISLSTYTDETQEIRHVCQKVRAITKVQPLAKIGILIPDLERRAENISRIFTEELAPHLSLTANTDTQGDYFNLSLGEPLAKQPMIQSALSILSLTVNPNITHAKITQLLLSPYIRGYADEQSQRAALDAWLRRKNQAQSSLKQWLKQCQISDLDTPELIHFITRIIEHTYDSSAFKGKQPLSKWMVLAEQILTQLDWHEQTHNQHRYEVAQVQNWRDLIMQLTGLDDFCSHISWSDALSLLQELAFEQLFRPAPSLANIQIMGLLEAANLRFDYAFVLGMDDTTWPKPANPHPLIPFNIQLLHQTPHASSEREWQYAQYVWRHTQHVAPTLEVSYAKSKEKQDVQPSPFIENITHHNDQHSLSSHRYALTLQQKPSKLTPIKDKTQPIDLNEEVRGGTGIIKSQSACAFQAFARYRLHLRGLQTPSLGLSAAEQGTLLHSALEHFWRETKTSAKLIHHIQQQTLEQTVATAVTAAWTSLDRFIKDELKLLETKRLQNLLLQWLTMESKRTPFMVVEFETWKNVKLGSQPTLLLHTKIDRIDKLGSGQHVVLDYKTGEASASQTMGYRPDEPQLCVYYLAEKTDPTHQVEALAFAQVRSGDMAFKGVAQEDDLLLNIKTFKGRKEQPQNWDELTTSWQENLDRLADEFMAGEANVAPKSVQSCTYCELSGLCRIQPQ